MTIEELLLPLTRNDYQRYDFDNFLTKVDFHYKTPSIHISGTNGKGSVATYIANIYIASGYKVGLFTSPHLRNINEMICVNNVSISEKDFIYYFKKYEKLFLKFNLSKFEVETFIALNYFDEQKCDIAIIECGMGGEEDATNIFTPLLSIITSVSLEHTLFLGRSISEIARAKAGIIKKNIPVLIGNLSTDALDVIKEVAFENKSNIFQADQYYDVKYVDNGLLFTYKPYQDLFIPSIANFEIVDATLALEAIKLLLDTFKVNEEGIRNGLNTSHMIARMNIINSHPYVIIDGAHNPEAMETLKQSLETLPFIKPIHVIFACFKDKNIERMLAELNFISSDITLTTFDHPRARTYEEYFLFAGEYPFVEDYQKAIVDKMNEFKDDIILITGSLAFASLVNDTFSSFAPTYEDISNKD